MAIDYDKIIFGNKKYSDLLKEVYQKHQKKDTQINALIIELKDLVEEPSDATLIVPMIKGYLETGVKNDDLLLKLVALIQKGEEKSGGKNDDVLDLGLTEAEKEALLKDAQRLMDGNEI